MVVNTSWQVIRLWSSKDQLPACLTKSFESERINHKKSSVFCALSGFSEDEAYDSALPLLLSVFQSITLPRPRFSLSSVNMLSCNGENPFRTNESVSSEKLTGDNSLKYLLTEYRTKKIVSWSLLLLFVLETITDYRPFWKIVKKILCTKLYTEYPQ